MHIVIYGPEGSGKGTQAKLLSEKLDLPIYTAGDLVREAAETNKGRIGDMARSVLLDGKYLPDGEMCNLIGEKLKDEELRKGFILDGFPRTLLQANYLMDNLSKNGYKIDKVIYLKLDEEESVRRLIKRKRKVFGKSKILHDDPKRIRQRLKIFHSSNCWSLFQLASRLPILKP